MSQISQDVARERLLDQVFDARTLAEIATAREALHAWMSSHPEEPGMADALEVLSHRTEIANDQETSMVKTKTAAVR